MKWRHWSILIILVLLNYLIFSTAFTQLAEQRQPGPRPTRTPWPTFENIEPSPVAWVVLPTSTPVPTRTPITPTPTMDTTASADNTSTIEATATVPENPPETVTRSTTATPTRTPKPPTATPSGQTIIHKVKRGQTLSEIAKDYGVTVKAIAEANGIEDPSHIITGQKLIIPAPDRTPPTAQATAPKEATPKPTKKPPTPTPTLPPTATATPTLSTSSLQFTAEVTWNPNVAPNCSGPAISKQSLIRDSAGNPVNGVRIEVDCYGNTWQSHPSGNPGEYEAGHYDFVFGQTTPKDWTCTARVLDVIGQPVDSSEVVTIAFDTNDCQPGGDGHQVAIVNWTKHW